jgi:hypothetical protein
MNGPKGELCAKITKTKKTTKTKIIGISHHILLWPKKENSLLTMPSLIFAELKKDLKICMVIALNSILKKVISQELTTIDEGPSRRVRARDCLNGPRGENKDPLSSEPWA